MEIRERKSFIITVIYYALIGTASIIFIKFGLPVIIPFVIGFLIAMLLKPAVIFISERFKIHKNIIAFSVMLLFYVTASLIIFFLGRRLIYEIINLAQSLPYIFSEIIMPVIEKAEQNLSAFLENLLNKDGASVYISNSLSALSDKLADFTASFVTSLVRSAPSFVVGCVFTVISSFFFIFDYYKITSFLSKLVPKRHREKIFRIKKIFGTSLKNMLKGYVIICAITFTELFLGLSLLKVENALALSVIIAVLDILPVIGSGTFLIPLSIFSFIYGRISLGFGILILYALITVIREIIEPKIIGKHIGLSPIVMLISVYVGAKLFGFCGIIIFPLAITVIKEIVYLEK